ncbi:MAG TPA: hypothetical protein VFX76_16955 [Roseiflexaceae bacterium]|nr:hypothetical protein [Roseiflexaceae bacterium]
MRRLVLGFALGGIGTVVMLCVAAGYVMQADDGLELVLPGATNVLISGRGTSRLRVSYDLPPSKRIPSVSQHLTYQGWRRITLENFDRPNPTFIRVRLFGFVREIVAINPRPAHRQSAELQLTRCLRIRTWIRCL